MLDVRVTEAEIETGCLCKYLCSEKLDPRRNSGHVLVHAGKRAMKFVHIQHEMVFQCYCSLCFNISELLLF